MNGLLKRTNESSITYLLIIIAAVVLVLGLCGVLGGCASGGNIDPQAAAAAASAWQSTLDETRQAAESAREQYDALTPEEQQSEAGQTLAAAIEQLSNKTAQLQQATDQALPLIQQILTAQQSGDPGDQAQAIAQGGSAIGQAVGGPVGIGITLGSLLLGSVVGGVQQYRAKRRAIDAAQRAEQERQQAKSQAVNLINAIEAAKAASANKATVDFANGGGAIVKAAMTSDVEQLVKQVRAKAA